MAGLLANYEVNCVSAEAADCTRAVRRSDVRGLLRHRGGGTVRDGSGVAGLVSGVARRMHWPDRLTSRLPGSGPDPGVWGLGFETEFTVDLSSADNGQAPAPGIWAPAPTGLRRLALRADPARLLDRGAGG